MGAVLIIDDEEDIQLSLAAVVRKEGHTVTTAGSGQEGLEALRSQVIDVIFLDIGLPDGDGIELIGSLKEVGFDTDVVMLTGINNAKTAVESLKAGAVDYIVKPFDIIEFKTILKRVMQSRVMAKRVLLEEKLVVENSIVCASKEMDSVCQAIEAASEVTSPVLITGETGTGKELVARAIHGSKQRQSGVLVKVDCSTLSANLMESELFGYDKGAFTDAVEGKKGLVEIANGGTLFLDEIGNLPISLQPKLLRLIEESTFRKVGGLKDIRVSLRIIAATNSNIEQAIAQHSFREDLFYRLNVISIPLPPLRHRKDDILLLANYFLHKFKKEFKKDVKGFTPAACAMLTAYRWPGNIRELRNLLEREMIFCKTEWISLADFITEKNNTGLHHHVDPRSLQEVEKTHIEKILNLTGNNKSEAARILGISRTTLRSKL